MTQRTKQILTAILFIVFFPITMFVLAYNAMMDDRGYD